MSKPNFIDKIHLAAREPRIRELHYRISLFIGLYCFVLIWSSSCLNLNQRILVLDVLCCFVYSFAMETIYSVEEVAAMLKLQPFTVRKMFREKKISGFKIGKAWRITESQLEAQIMGLARGEQVSEASHSPQAGSLDRSSVPEKGRYRAPKSREPVKESAPASDSTQIEAGTGSLLIYSETAGEEVFLNGESKGPTTLSLLDVAAGAYTLKVGEVQETINVLSGNELRIRAAGGVLKITARSSGPAPEPASPKATSNLLLQIENHSDMAGDIVVQLAGESAEATSGLFADYAGAPPAGMTITEGRVQLLGTLLKGQPAVLFDGPIASAGGKHLEVTVPKQTGIDKEIRQTFPITGDLSLKLSISTGRMLRGKVSIRIKREK